MTLKYLLPHLTVTVTVPFLSFWLDEHWFLFITEGRTEEEEEQTSSDEEDDLSDSSVEENGEDISEESVGFSSYMEEMDRQLGSTKIGRSFQKVKLLNVISTLQYA